MRGFEDHISCRNRRISAASHDDLSSRGHASEQDPGGIRPLPGRHRRHRPRTQAASRRRTDHHRPRPLLRHGAGEPRRFAAALPASARGRRGVRHRSPLDQRHLCRRQAHRGFDAAARRQHSGNRPAGAEARAAQHARGQGGPGARPRPREGAQLRALAPALADRHRHGPGRMVHRALGESRRRRLRLRRAR